MRKLADYEFEERDLGDSWEIRVVVPKNVGETATPIPRLVGLDAYQMHVTYVSATTAGLAEHFGAPWLEDILEDIAVKACEAAEYENQKAEWVS